MITLAIQLISRPEMPADEARDYIAEIFAKNLVLISGPDITGEVRLKLTQDKLTDEQRDWLHCDTFAARHIDSYKVEGSTGKQAYRHNYPDSKVFYYHQDCVEHNPPSGVTFELIPLSDVPSGVECDFCYEPVHGLSGYEIRQGTIELTMMLYGVSNASGESFTEKRAMELFNTLSDSAEHQAQLSSMPGYRITRVRIEGNRQSGRVYATFEKQA